MAATARADTSVQRPAARRDQRPADVLVVFGITGDLARVMTFRSLYRLEPRGLLDCPIVGVAVDDWTRDQLVQRARESIEGTGEVTRPGGVRPVRGAAVVRARRLRRRRPPTSGSADAIEGAERPVFYLEIPPFLFGTVVKGLAEADLTRSARVVVEKPFGHDQASAARAGGRAAPVHRRVPAVPDRPLPREDGARRDPAPAVRQRDPRAGVEPQLPRRACRSPWPRDFGVEDRGHFYDPVGALRDVVVNHLMQVVAAAAMEPPSRGDPQTIKDAQVALFRAVAEADPAHYVRGQYDGYLDIDGVAADSTTETYAALRLDIENWRWSGVPFFIRTGKRLPVTQTELRLVFKRPPPLGLRAHGVARPRPTSSSSSWTRRPGSG